MGATCITDGSLHEDYILVVQIHTVYLPIHQTMNVGLTDQSVFLVQSVGHPSQDVWRWCTLENTDDVAFLNAIVREAGYAFHGDEQLTILDNIQPPKKEPGLARWIS